MKTLFYYAAIALFALLAATVLGFVLGSLMHNTVARVMHVVATI